jgi:hypothetical protein
MDEIKKAAEEMRGAKDPLFVTCEARAPYSGCYHEENLFALVKGEVFPLYVSGKAGAEGDWNIPLFDLRDHSVRVDLEEFVEYMEEQDQYYDSWEVCPIEEAHCEDNLHNTVTVLLHNLGLPGPSFCCDECGRELRGLTKFLGYHGNGGVGVVLTNPCCSECFEDLEWCDSCVTHVMPQDGFCPDWEEADDPDDQEEHELSPAEDEAAKFGMDGSRVLLRAEGTPPTIVIIQKGVE